MADIGSLPNGPVQRRYCFYNATTSEVDFSNENHTNENNINNMEDNSESKMKNAHGKDVNSNGTTTTTTTNFVTDTTLPSNSSDDVEDILRSLKETEDLGFCNMNNVSATSTPQHNTTTNQQNHDNIDVNNEIQHFDNDFNPFSSLGLEQEGSNHSDDSYKNKGNAKVQHYPNKSNPQQSQQQQQDSHYENVVREALYHIRLRSQKRAALFKASGVGKSTTTSQPNNNNEALQQLSNEALTSMFTSSSGTIPEIGSTSQSGVSSGGSNTTTVTSSGLQLDPTSRSSTSTPSSNNNYRRPSSAALMNATKLDDRLLSPPADVRKAVELSAVEMFRNYDSSFGSHSRYEDNQTNTTFDDEKNKSNDQPFSSLSRLQLANPVFSILSSATGEGTGVQGGGVTTSTGISDISNSQRCNNNDTATPEQQHIELELERKFRREEEIEKVVEKVLLAILQSANVPSSSSTTDYQAGIISDAFSTLSVVDNNTDIVPSASRRPVPLDNDDLMTNNDEDLTDDVTLPRTPSKASCSVVDELLAEGDEEDTHEIPATSVGENHEQPQAPFDSLDEPNHNSDIHVQPHSSKNNASIRPYTVEADGTLEVEAVDRGSRQSSFNSNGIDYEFEGGGNEMVLGPLNKVCGGTTGVVLHDTDSEDEDIGDSFNSTTDNEGTTANEDSTDNYDSDSESESDSENDELEMKKVRKETNISATKKFQGKAKAPMKIIESITAAVRNNSKASELISKFSGDKRRSDEIFIPRRGSLPKIKELYAHMLPYQSNKSAVKKNAAFTTWFTENLDGVFDKAPPVHPWDEDDPDELGYIIHTFSRLQLQLIEQDYDELMDKVKKKFEAAVKKGTVRMFQKKNERDLQESAKSRPSSKQRSRNSLTGKGGLRTSPSHGSHLKEAGENRVGMGKRKLINDHLATNPNFPNAKPAGSGGVGDLEIYHLPIIYKAHQTGFEPTKDLVLQPDTVFAGNYYVQSELGSAAFSTAYRCVDLNSGKKGDDGETYYDEVCLKVIKNTKDFFDQSLDEIKILELLRQTNQCHENNILEMKTFFYHKEHLIIVTELLRQNLFEFGKYITDNEEPQYFTRNRLCYICRQCLVALSFVHKLGLVHSDIKPENILLASYSRARVKVIDFGSSCYLTDRQSSYIQSRSYRAPEVVLGLPYSGKIDIWSLGCVIAEMYTGQVTFQNDSVVTMLSRIEAICGAFPTQMIENGRQSGQFFTPTGLLYEKADYDDDSECRHNQSPSAPEEESSNGDNELFNVFQPKITTMAERLGFDPNLMEKKRKSRGEEEKALFVDFVTKLLTIDPDKRPTADEALEHPWILSGYNVSEEDLKYPPEE